MKRSVVIAVRITEEQAAAVDRLRGELTRSQWLRLLMLEARKKSD